MSAESFTQGAGEVRSGPADPARMGVSPASDRARSGSRDGGASLLDLGAASTGPGYTVTPQGFLVRCGVLLAVVAALSASAACRARGGTAGSPDQSVRRYTVRAEVVSLPSQPGGDLTLRHESIDDFRDETGAVVGMSSMVMPFPVARGVSLDGLAPDAKVEAILAVDWERVVYQIERIRKLPPGTVLHLGKANEASTTTTNEKARP